MERADLARQLEAEWNDPVRFPLDVKLEISPLDYREPTTPSNAPVEKCCEKCFNIHQTDMKLFDCPCHTTPPIQEGATPFMDLAEKVLDHAQIEAGLKRAGLKRAEDIIQRYKELEDEEERRNRPATIGDVEDMIKAALSDEITKNK